MKARALKKILNNPAYAIHETDDHICIGSPLCSDLISIRKDNMKMRYALDTFNEGKRSIKSNELLWIWEKLEQIILTGEIKDIIYGEDIIDNPLPVFSFDENYHIIKSFTDEYGWPNTDFIGRLMYNNVWFKTEKEEIEKAILSCECGIKWREETAEEKRAEIEKLENKIQTSKEAKARLDALLKAQAA